jgi:serine phosphatase RsbU (regulator of sigma subunit)
MKKMENHFRRRENFFSHAERTRMKRILFYSFLSFVTLLSLAVEFSLFLQFLLFTSLIVLLCESTKKRTVPDEHLFPIFFSLIALVLILSHACGTFLKPEQGSSSLFMMTFIAEFLIFSIALLASAFFFVISFQTGRTLSTFFLIIGFFFLLIHTSFEGFYPIFILFFFLFAISRPFLEELSQRFKLWLFLGLLIGWIFYIFIVMPKDTLYNPGWAGGIFLSSHFYSSLILLLLTISLAFTISLPLSLIIGSRKTRTKTAASYIFLSIIPILILVALIWLYVLFQLKLFPVFLIWRENVGAVKNLTQELSLETETLLKNVPASGSELSLKLKNTCQKYEDILSTQFSKPAVFIALLPPKSDIPITQASSTNAASMSPSVLIRPVWFENVSKTWIFLENQKLFLKGVQYQDYVGFRTAVSIYIPLEEQNVDTIYPREYRFSIHFETHSESHSKIPNKIPSRPRISLEEFIRTISSGQFPIPAIKWETGEYLLGGSFTVHAYTLKGVSSSLFFYLTTIYIILFLGSFLAFNMIILSSILGYAINKTLKKSFNAIVHGASHFSKGNFQHKIHLKSRDEFNTIANALNQMAIGIQKYTEEVIKKELMDRELSIASEIQKRIFPDAPPSSKSFDFGVICRPFGKVGGDYYDFIEYAEDELAVVVADASGKGMPAALMVSSLNAILHSYAKQENLTAFIATINKRLRKVATENAFISMVFCVFYENRNSINYINAGHPYPIMIKGGNRHLLLKEGGVSLGMLDDIQMKEGICEMERGDIIILMTDGVIETFNQAGEEFGIERLKETVMKHCDRKAQEIAEIVFQELENFSKSEQLTDDATCIIIKKN